MSEEIEYETVQAKFLKLCGLGEEQNLSVKEADYRTL